MSNPIQRKILKYFLFWDICIGIKRFGDAVTALSGAFALAIPHPQAMDTTDEVAFFQAIKARLVKFEGD